MISMSEGNELFKSSIYNILQYICSKPQGNKHAVPELWCKKLTHQRIVGGEQVTAGAG